MLLAAALIELLCWELREPDLVQPLLELRRRELRKNSRGDKNGVPYSRVQQLAAAEARV